MRKSYRIWLIVFLFIFGVLSLYSQDIVQQASEKLKKISKLEGEEFWRTVQEIESLGKDIRPVVENGLRSPQTPIRLACAKLSYTLGNKQDAVLTLLAIIKEEKNPRLRESAGELLATLIKGDDGYGDKEKIAEEISRRLEEVLPPRLRLALCRALYYITPKSWVVKEILNLLKLKNEDPELYFDAALTLGELGYFEKVTDALKILATYPTQKGKLAQALLEKKLIEDAYNRKQTSERKKEYDYDFKILNEIFNLIKNYYVDPERFNVKALLEAAAKGVANSLDPFSSYQTEEEKKRSQESLNLRYAGIGAYVNIRDEILTIERPIYGGPAYKAGLRSLDRIIEIDGEPTRGKDIDYLVNKLRGPPNTEVKIKVSRKGWAREREFVLKRAIIQIETARAQMLPGRIGYISLLTFGTTTAEEMKKCLQNLEEEEVEALIIDLRRNSGGLLDAVLAIIDMFLEKDKLVLTTKDKQGAKIEEYKTRDNDKITYPIYVLVDNGSASGAEILAGVLQDYKRAVIIGERTFGKGSVQNIIELDSTERKTALRLTVAKYYLPSGRCIHKEKDAEGGIEPDIKIISEERDPWKDFAFNKIYDSGELTKYYQKYAPIMGELFKQLAEDDGMDWKRYPDFEGFYQTVKEKLQTHVTEDEVRQILREYIRRRVQDERGKEFIVDLQNDIVLQRAIIEALKKLKINPETISEYKPFAHKFNQHEKESSTLPPGNSNPTQESPK